MPLINVSDFSGMYVIGKNSYNTTAIQDLCNQTVSEYMTRIFGADLAQLILTDIGSGSAPTNPLYLALWGELRFQSCHWNFYSAGMHKILLSLCYYRVTYAQMTNPTIYGAVNSSLENSTQKVNGMPSTVNMIHNEGVIWAKAVQRYLRDNMGDYPEYNGEEILLNYR